MEQPAERWQLVRRRRRRRRPTAMPDRGCNYRRRQPHVEQQQYKRGQEAPPMSGASAALSRRGERRRLAPPPPIDVDVWCDILAFSALKSVCSLALVCRRLAKLVRWRLTHTLLVCKVGDVEWHIPSRRTFMSPRSCVDPALFPIVVTKTRILGGSSSPTVTNYSRIYVRRLELTFVAVDSVKSPLNFRRCRCSLHRPRNFVSFPPPLHVSDGLAI